MHWYSSIVEESLTERPMKNGIPGLPVDSAPDMIVAALQELGFPAENVRPIPLRKDRLGCLFYAGLGHINQEKLQRLYGVNTLLNMPGVTIERWRGRVGPPNVTVARHSGTHRPIDTVRSDVYAAEGSSAREYCTPSPPDKPRPYQRTRQRRQGQGTGKGRRSDTAALPPKVLPTMTAPQTKPGPPMATLEPPRNRRDRPEQPITREPTPKAPVPTMAPRSPRSERAPSQRSQIATILPRRHRR
ncbi:hypothetical protein EVAR_84977_1 [Eumeta japonica]|uniref:Uncharacterized protein n=1 Tax=Eumeta variegata TaxID=151549 RepID=A0A4C1VHD8_EUMVA|nr:hypothetical protein EVAR_84977_1 [Eumeta japonica]